MVNDELSPDQEFFLKAVEMRDRLSGNRPYLETEDIALIRWMSKTLVERQKKEDISRRVTRNYNDDCSYLDKWVYEGQASVIHLSKTVLEQKNGDSPIVEETFRVICYPEGESMETFKQGLRDLFTRGSCSCQHDCCGCPQSWVESIEEIGSETELKLVLMSQKRW